MKNLFPERGIWSRRPADRWEDALVAGNGSHGVMVYGDPVKDTIIGNHCRLYLPQGNSHEIPDLAPFLTETRAIIATEGYEKAIKFQYEKAKELGYQGLTMSDPFHPGFHLLIGTDHKEFDNYSRCINYQTGELTVSYMVRGRQYERRTFVSHADNRIYHQLSPGNYKLYLKNYKNDKLIQSSFQNQSLLQTNFSYVYGDGGYDVMIRIKSEKLSPIQNRTGFYVESGSNILIEMQIVPYSDTHTREVIKTPLYPIASYHKLFDQHKNIHQEKFKRVELNLVSSEERFKCIDDIILNAKSKNSVCPVLLEKMYDAGRYMYICSAGELSPNLQGIWTGTFEPAWSGDFTFDTNVQLSIASALSSNLLEGMEGFFRLIKELLPGFRENAQKYYGSRGIMAAIHASNTGRHFHWNEDWPLHFWTCGAGWLAHWFYEYYRFTGDQLFLKEEVIPLLKEVVLFYEDFLVEDNDGTYRFTPSYSAENGCADNATQDIAVLKQVLNNLLEAHRILNLHCAKVSQWKRMIAKLPSYKVNEEGALKEWISDKEENYNHRHFSHLYPVFQSREFNENTQPEWWEASRIAFEKRLEAWLLNENGDTTSTHGRMHSALCATQFHMSELVEEIFHLLVKNDCFYTSLMMSHYDNQEVFNVDGNGALPQVIHEMLVDNSNKRLTLLGALPASLPSGEIKGIRLPDQLTVNYLYWNLEEKVIKIEITSEIEQVLEIYLPLFKKARLQDHRMMFKQGKRESLEIYL
ncbi:Glycosyl hydrolase family 65, N-terminal domain [Gracilibacillus ureilyticus]|uniref:Glycosyl hydrolase family 65, N-terminal domain n=1 Tax=Gracilibacillus ureilyticus TaxID=531814 RepID=A0A1H9PSE7_9BACI|nr:glycoside hydrolase N-terminal domain-containing protein [Gracilibacillus ureilyticus]SER51112.1 Glycosyl hydrolase family 65, N-terminal domain [Gracilibacillus ureilyticus]